MYQNIHFQGVLDFINDLSHEDQGKIRLAFDAIERGYFNAVHVKNVRSPVKELIVRQYRILFVIKSKEIYFLTMFIKKTRKTPVQEIDRAFKILKLLK